MSYSLEKYGELISSARKKAGITQAQLSEGTGIPQPHISKIERGKSDLRLSSMIEICRFLNLEIELVPKKHVLIVQAILSQIEKPGPDILSQPMYRLDD